MANLKPKIENLKHFQEVTTEEEREKKVEAGKASGRNKTKRTEFKKIFNKYLTDTKREDIVKEFCGLMTSSDTAPRDKVKIFEIILKCLGELNGEILTKNELDVMSDAVTIELKID